MSIEYGAFGYIEERFEKQEISDLTKEKAKEIINKVKILAIRSVGNLLGDYNNNQL